MSVYTASGSYASCPLGIHDSAEPQIIALPSMPALTNSTEAVGDREVLVDRTAGRTARLRMPVI